MLAYSLARFEDDGLPTDTSEEQVRRITRPVCRDVRKRVHIIG